MYFLFLLISKFVIIFIKFTLLSIIHYFISKFIIIFTYLIKSYEEIKTFNCEKNYVNFPY